LAQAMSTQVVTPAFVAYRSDGFVGAPSSQSPSRRPPPGVRARPQAAPVLVETLPRAGTFDGRASVPGLAAAPQRSSSPIIHGASGSDAFNGGFQQRPAAVSPPQALAPTLEPLPGSTPIAYREIPAVTVRPATVDRRPDVSDSGHLSGSIDLAMVQAPPAHDGARRTANGAVGSPARANDHSGAGRSPLTIVASPGQQWSRLYPGDPASSNRDVRSTTPVRIRAASGNRAFHAALPATVVGSRQPTETHVLESITPVAVHDTTDRTTGHESEPPVPMNYNTSFHMNGPEHSARASSKTSSAPTVLPALATAAQLLDNTSIAGAPLQQGARGVSREASDDVSTVVLYSTPLQGTIEGDDVTGPSIASAGGGSGAPPRPQRPGSMPDWALDVADAALSTRTLDSLDGAPSKFFQRAIPSHLVVPPSRLATGIPRSGRDPALLVAQGARRTMSMEPGAPPLPVPNTPKCASSSDVLAPVRLPSHGVDKLSNSEPASPVAPSRQSRGSSRSASPTRRRGSSHSSSPAFGFGHLLSPSRSSVLSFSKDDPESARQSAFSLPEDGFNGSFSQGQKSLCSNCGNTGADSFGRPCLCRHGRGAPGTMVSLHEELQPPVVGTVSARNFLAAELEGRLLGLKAQQLQAHSLDLPSLETDRCMAERLRSELQEVTERARGFASAIEAQKSCLRELQMAHGRPPRSPSEQAVGDDPHALDSEVAHAEISEAQRQLRVTEDNMARAHEEAQASQARARVLGARSDELQRGLQEAKDSFEERRFEARTQSATAMAFDGLRRSIGRLKGEAHQAAEATVLLRLNNGELEDEVERLQADHAVATELLQEQSAARETLFGRVAKLAFASSGGLGPPHGSSVEELVARLRMDREEAQRRSAQRQAQRQALESQCVELRPKVASTLEVARRAMSRREDMECDLAVVKRHRCARQRFVDDEFNSAQAEHRLLTEAQTEWRLARPQLVRLIEELRVDGCQGAALARDLSDRPAALKGVVDHCRQGGAGCREDDGDSIGTIADITAAGPSMAVDVSGANSGDNEDLHPAVEENDILHKKVLSLEAEKAALIRDQEELIHYIKAKVAPIQRAFGLST